MCISDERILKDFHRKNILVTGGTGLIGRQIVNILSKADAFLRIVSLDQIEVDKKAEHIVGDLSDFTFCKEIVRDIDYVFHLAGVQGTVQTSSSMVASHFVPTLMMNTNVIEATRLSGVKKLVYTSSIGAYPENAILREKDYKIESTPMAFAGWAKRMAELQIIAYKAQYDLDTFSIVRLSNVFGPGDNFNPETAMVIPALICRVFKGENPLIVWGDGKTTRDFLYSRDAAKGIILALHKGTNGEFVNIGSGQGHSVQNIIDVLQSLVEFECEFDTTKSGGAAQRIMDITLAKKKLGFYPVTKFKDGIRKTWEWFGKHPDEYMNKVNHFIGTDRD